MKERKSAYDISGGKGKELELHRDAERLAKNARAVTEEVGAENAGSPAGAAGVNKDTAGGVSARDVAPKYGSPKDARTVANEAGVKVPGVSREPGTNSKSAAGGVSARDVVQKKDMEHFRVDAQSGKRARAVAGKDGVKGDKAPDAQGAAGKAAVSGASARDVVQKNGMDQFRSAAQSAKDARAVLADNGDDPEAETVAKLQKTTDAAAGNVKRAMRRLASHKKAAGNQKLSGSAAGGGRSAREVLGGNTAKGTIGAQTDKRADFGAMAAPAPGPGKFSNASGKASAPRALAKEQVMKRSREKARRKAAAKAVKKKAAKTIQKTVKKAAVRGTAKIAGKALLHAMSPLGIIAALIVVIILIVILIVALLAADEMNKSMSYDGAFFFPLQNHENHNCEFTDTFGASRDGGRRGHSGTDIGAVEGEPIYAMVNGKVVTNRWNGTANPGGTGGGWEITVEDEAGRRYKCLHMMEQSTLPVGTEVYAGQTILGYVGHTGANITANHLHLSMYDENGNIVNAYELLRRSHDNPIGDASGNLPASGGKPAVLNSVVMKPAGVLAPVQTITGCRITYYSGGEGETVDRYGNKLVIGTAAKWMGLTNAPYPQGFPDGTIFSIGEGAEERFYKISDVGGFGRQPTEVKKKTFDLFAGANVSAAELTSSKYGVQTGVTIKIWKWG
ncbi:MAG TPA: hypothetical protein DEB31_11350 [Clostridiales bacterium]|nr:hypothetical protein [Clostridiales bacterium]